LIRETVGEPDVGVASPKGVTRIATPYSLIFMERGLMWLPLLGAFIWLARAGANEYQKLEAYKRWAVGFDRYKYDIYSVIGIKGRELSWGKPTKKEPKDLQTFSLDRVKQIQLVVDNQQIDLDNLPTGGKNINLQFQLTDTANMIDIPFTEVLMASEWAKFLREQIS
jgi:hypothetical protein